MSVQPLEPFPPIFGSLSLSLSLSSSLDPFSSDLSTGGITVDTTCLQVPLIHYLCKFNILSIPFTLNEVSLNLDDGMEGIALPHNSFTFFTFHLHYMYR